MKLKKYTKIKITANALVPRGAVQEKAIFKDGEQRILLTDVIKSEEKQMMYSIMFHLNKSDSQNCIVEDAKVLEAAARDFMKSGAKNLKILHEGNLTDGAEIQELWIIKAGDPIFTKPDQVGALANCIYFPDKELFQKMKTEGWETSIEGQAEEIEIEKDDPSWIEKIAKKVMEMLNIKKEVTKMNPDEIKALILETVTPLINALKEEIKPKEPETEKEPEKETPPPVDDEMKKELTDLKKEIADLKKTNETIMTDLKKHGSTQAKEHEKEDEKPKFKKGFLGNYQIKEKD